MLVLIVSPILSLRTGEPDGPPCKVGVAVTDVSTGLYAHGAIMAALLSRQQTGEGTWIDCNLFDSQVCLYALFGMRSLTLSSKLAGLANIASNYLIAGQEAGRHGTAHPSIVPYQVFPCQDGFIMIGAGNDKQACHSSVLVLTSLISHFQFAILADRILERPDLALNPRFSTNSARVAHIADVVDIISQKLQQHSRDHWLAKFKGLGYV